MSNLSSKSSLCDGSIGPQLPQFQPWIFDLFDDATQAQKGRPAGIGVESKPAFMADQRRHIGLRNAGLVQGCFDVLAKGMKRDALPVDADAAAIFRAAPREIPA